MNRRGAFAAAVLLAVLGASLLIGSRRAEDTGGPGPVAAPAAPAGIPPKPPPASERAPGAGAGVAGKAPGVPESVRRAFEQEVGALLRFREALQAFLAEAPDLAPLERDRRARILLERLAALADAGRVTPDERLLVELGLRRWLRAPEAWSRRAEALVAEARARAEAEREARRERTPDPRLPLYRARAEAVTRQVLEDTRGLPEAERQARLRERLQALRSELWSREAPGS